MDFTVGSDFDYFLQHLIPQEYQQPQLQFIPQPGLSNYPFVQQHQQQLINVPHQNSEKISNLVTQASSLSIEPEQNSRKRLMADPLDEGGRNKVRKENQNLACRNYRRRKKEYMTELEDKIADLEQQNILLKQQNIQLKHAPVAHKSALFEINPSMIALQNDGRELCGRIEEAITTGDERVMKYHLHLWMMHVERIHQFAQQEMDKFINPMFQVKLSLMGYEQDESANIPKHISVASAGWFEMYKGIANLSPEQTSHLESVRSEHKIKEDEAKQERLNLDKKIKDFLLNKLQIKPCYELKKERTDTNIDPGDILDFARNVHLLKKNYIASKLSVNEVVMKLEKVLSPKQHLQLIALMTKKSMPPASFMQSFQLINKAYSMFAGNM